jgi:hypothetical protein
MAQEHRVPLGRFGRARGGLRLGLGLRVVRLGVVRLGVVRGSWIQCTPSPCWGPSTGRSSAIGRWSSETGSTSGADSGVTGSGFTR